MCLHVCMNMKKAIEEYVPYSPQWASHKVKNKKGLWEDYFWKHFFIASLVIIDIYYENKFENEYIKLFFKSLPFISLKSSLRKSHQTEVLISLYCLNFYYKVYTLNRLIHLFNKYFLSSMMVLVLVNKYYMCMCVFTKLTHDVGSYMEAHIKSS